MRGFVARMPGAGAAAALVLGLGVVACAPDFEEPTIEIVGISGGNIGLDGGTLLLLVRVDNPNDFAIEASRVDYDLDIRRDGDWYDLAAGELDRGLTVAALESSSIEIPVEFRLGDAIEVGAELLRGGNPRFRVAGSVDLRRPIRRRVPYSEEITADFDRAARGRQ